MGRLMAREYLRPCSFSNNFVRKAVCSNGLRATRSSEEPRVSMTERLHGTKPNLYHSNEEKKDR